MAITNVAMTGLQGLADLEQMEGPWLKGMATSDLETTATVVRLLRDGAGSHGVGVGHHPAGCRCLPR